MPRLAFWYDFASTYSHLSAQRIDALAAAQGVSIDWRPFLLGPIFAAQGWRDSPFNLFPTKGRYMWRDVERRAAAMGLPMLRLVPFPQNSLLAARVTLAVDEADRPSLTRAIFAAEFSQGRAISEPGVLAACLGALGLEAAAVLARTAMPEVKAALRANTEAAMAQGIFGAPSFVAADGELFWGDDRLEEALAWAKRPGPR